MQRWKSLQKMLILSVWSTMERIPRNVNPATIDSIVRLNWACTCIAPDNTHRLMTAKPALEDVWRTVKLFNSFHINFHCTGFHNFYVVIQRVCKKLVQFHWLHFLLFSTVCFQMSPQIICLRRGKGTLVAFVWLFSTVGFQMFPQMACLRRGIVTLVAFVWLFSTVRFQMCPQIACLRGCIITQVAFVWFFATVYFQMCL